MLICEFANGSKIVLPVHQTRRHGSRVVPMVRQISAIFYSLLTQRRQLGWAGLATARPVRHDSAPA